ncbi:hypothetical protein Taro_019986 [Colocasia esculenta]|uniref:Uncharacterized protein n=1 Tax=Colocasia esculenta TaxID=4460 RepID=A0A843V0T0_COLES|nr:hypothetical protein [Colocasia esculenta]
MIAGGGTRWRAIFTLYISSFFSNCWFHCLDQRSTASPDDSADLTLKEHSGRSSSEYPMGNPISEIQKRQQAPEMGTQKPHAGSRDGRSPLGEPSMGSRDGSPMQFPPLEKLPQLAPSPHVNPPTLDAGLEELRLQHPSSPLGPTTPSYTMARGQETGVSKNRSSDKSEKGKRSSSSSLLQHPFHPPSPSPSWSPEPSLLASQPATSERLST